MDDRSADLTLAATAPAKGASVTVVVPVYNTEPYLPDCLDSLISQTYANVQIIVVDDCSPGECSKIVRSYQERFANIEYIRHKENRGLLCARLTGVRNASSEYIAFLDSDDTAKSHFIERLVTVAEATGADIVNSAVKEKQSSEFSLAGSEAIIAALCSRQIPNIAAWTKLFRRTLFEKTPELMEFGQREHIVRSEDRVLTTSLCRGAEFFVQISDILVDYNTTRQDSSTNDMNISHLQKEMLDMQKIAVYFRGILAKDVYRIILSQMMNIYNVKIRHLDERGRELILDQLASGPAATDVMPMLVKAVDDYLAEVLKKNQRLKSQLDTLNLEVEKINNRIRQIEASWLWRATRPLRWLQKRLSAIPIRRS